MGLYRQPRVSTATRFHLFDLPISKLQTGTHLRGRPPTHPCSLNLNHNPLRNLHNNPTRDPCLGLAPHCVNQQRSSDSSPPIWTTTIPQPTPLSSTTNVAKTR